ncbi:hypothetical protein B566_EDAN001393 [Ephemera danica]|nr:hypothetical protein B566_EDAN001393 [Ephemera danica]
MASFSLFAFASRKSRGTHSSIVAIFARVPAIQFPNLSAKLTLYTMLNIKYLVCHRIPVDHHLHEVLWTKLQAPGDLCLHADLCDLDGQGLMGLYIPVVHGRLLFLEVRGSHLNQRLPTNSIYVQGSHLALCSPRLLSFHTSQVGQGQLRSLVLRFHLYFHHGLFLQGTLGDPFRQDILSRSQRVNLLQNF